MKPRKLTTNELATVQWSKLIKGAKRKDKSEIYFASKRKLKIKAPPIQSVASCVANHYNLSYDRLLNCRQNKIVARYRWVLFYICKRVLGYSFRKITNMLGLAEGTVYRGLKSLLELRLIDPSVGTDIHSIRIQLNRKFAQ